MRKVREWRNVDRAMFEGEIGPAHEPAVLRGLVGDWPAVAAASSPRATADYVAAMDSGRLVETFVGPPEIGGRFYYSDDMRGFNFARYKVPLGAVLDRLLEQADQSDPPAIYAGAAATPDHAPAFAAANPMPLLDADVAPRVWVGNAARVATHYDLSNNIACVVAGRRRFTLFPPEQVANLYVGPLEHTMAGQPVSMADPEAPDFQRFPRFAAALAVAQVAELEPGDALFIPTLWWHQVQSFGPLSLLVNYWWGQAAGPSPFETLIHGLLTVRDLPRKERDAWRAIFEHYLFQDGIDPAAHLPPAARGVLGPASSQRSRTIRDFLMRALGRSA